MQSNLIRSIKSSVFSSTAVLAVIFLGVLSFVFVKEWINSLPQFGGDWHYVFQEHIQEENRFPQLWEHSENLGSSQAGRIALGLLDLIQARIADATGADFAQTEVIIWFLPFVMSSFLGIFLLSKKLFKNNKAALIAGFVYTLNTYSIVLFAEAGHINILVAYGFVPLAINSFISLIGKPNFWNAFLFTLLQSVVFIFDIRIGFIGLIPLVILLFSKFFFIRKSLSTKLLLSLFFGGFLFIIINLFWLIPIITTPQEQILASGQADSVWVERLSYQELSHALTLSHPFFSQEGISYFSANPVSPFAIILSVFIIFGVIKAVKKDKKTVFVLLGILLIGSFFVKGANEPFGSVYIWMFENIPGFTMFREPQKFYVLSALPYSLLLGYGVVRFASFLSELNLRKQKQLKLISYSLFLLIYFMILLPVFSGKIEGNLKARELPEYSHRIEEIIANNKDFYRVLWIPQVTSSAFRSDSNPRLDFNVAISELVGSDNYNSASIYEYVTSNQFQYILSSMSVKYIVFANDPEVNRWYSSGVKEAENYLINSGDYTVVQDETYTILENKRFDSLFTRLNRPLITNSEIADLNLPENTFNVGRSYIFPEGTDLTGDIYGKTDKRLYLTVNNSIVSVDEGSISTLVKLEENDIFNINNTASPYVKVNFQRQSDGSYIIHAVGNKENILIGDQEIDLNNVQFKSTTRTYIDPNLEYFVRGEAGGISFMPEEIVAGTTKGFVKINTNQPVLEVFAENSQQYVAESFREDSVLEIGDCNNYDNTSLEDNQILYRLSNDSPDGSKSFLLSANNHIACFNKSFFPSPEDQIALLSLNYKQISGSLPEICIFDHEKDSCVYRTELAQASAVEWKRLELPFLLDKETTRYSVYLYTNALESPSRNLYDNLSVKGFRSIDRLSLDKIPANQPADSIFVAGREQTIKYNSELVQRIPIYNSSFDMPIDHRLFVKDCNNKDKSELEANGINAWLDNESVDGRYSLALEGNRHSACYSVPIGLLNKVVQNHFTFSYKSNNNSYVKYCLLNTNTGQCDLQEVLKPSSKWTEYSFIFRARSEANYELYISTFAEQGDDHYYLAKIDNLRVYSIPVDYNHKLYLSAEIAGNIENSPINYQRLGHASYLLDVKEYKGQDLLLKFSQQKNQGWIVYKTNDASLETGFFSRLGRLLGNVVTYDVQNFKVDGFANAWLLEEIDSDYILIEYRPQTQADLYLLVSLSSMVLILPSIVLMRVVKRVGKR
ncbi:MAG: hypothetical protein QY330_02695 [Candidatus Dojkabacteria bacterium]|uniref:DUF3367 domain-containing protein n=1 Tax=Candidatus Dojkabacteria bacterium TaxID=2099670 RepID=A0A952AHV2_9BACT|nr:hypothetical protein [Candidatus Dojkabacteria bacterium]WKZ28482.1 MAG: hypothetical protein QY330_02695 [Candidatus Dojkabacteria bacterium]